MSVKAATGVSVFLQGDQIAWLEAECARLKTTRSQLLRALVVDAMVADRKDRGLKR